MSSSYTAQIFHKILQLVLVCVFSANICFADDVVEKSALDIKNQIINKCLEDNNKKLLSVGWSNSPPYQYSIFQAGNHKLSGLDISIVKYIANKAGYELTFQNREWDDQQNSVADGLQDLALGATYNEERADYAYFSLPYRQEEDCLFLSADNHNIFDLKNVTELLTQIRLQNFRLGLIKKDVYLDPLITAFISSTNNQDILKSYNNVSECITAIEKGEIDGFLSERVFASYALMNSSYQFKTIVLSKPTPIHLMFSKSTVPINIVQKFNKEIQDLIGTDLYKQIVKDYLYSNLFIQLLSTSWFSIISIIGTIGFTISGFAIATKQNMPIIKAFITSIIPSSFGIIIKDLLIDKSKDGNNFSLEHILAFSGTVVIFYIIFLILQYLNRSNKETKIIDDFLSNLIIIGDALGKSCFFSIGIAASIIFKLNPVIIIPLSGIILAHLGVAVRNLMATGQINLADELNLEVTLLWSSILTFYIYYNSLQLNSNKIEYILVITIIGCFITRLLTHYLKIPNIKLQLFK
jgi:polar amino acid transport system substrate-binding protein